MWFLILVAIVAVCAFAYVNRVSLLAKSETRINRQLKRRPPRS